MIKVYFINLCLVLRNEKRYHQDAYHEPFGTVPVLLFEEALMNKACIFLFLGAFALVFFIGPPAKAQNAVANPCFTTTDLQHWSYEDPTYACVPGNSSLGMTLYCARKNPGSPDNNGAMEQQVHLIAGNTYEFSANIASKYCTS
jgi:hypothetical protein